VHPRVNVASMIWHALCYVGGMTTATMTQLRALYWAPSEDQILALAARDGWLPAGPGSAHAAACGEHDPGTARLRAILNGGYARSLAGDDWTAEHLAQGRVTRTATLDERSGAAVTYHATLDAPAPMLAQVGLFPIVGPVASPSTVAVDPDEQRAEALRAGRRLLATVTAGELCDLLRLRQSTCWTAARAGRSDYEACAVALADALSVALAKCVDLERELRRARDAIQVTSIVGAMIEVDASPATT